MMNKKTFLTCITAIILLGVMFSIPLISAFDFDNVVSQDSLIKSKYVISESANKYPALKIENTFGLGEKLLEAVLIEHTESCGQDCFSEFTIQTFTRSALIDDIKFLRLTEDNRWVDGNIRNYKFYIKTNEEEYSVNDYEIKCEVVGYDKKNNSEIKECNEVIVGTHKEKKPLWEEYNIGDIKEAGTYQIKLEGQKRPDWTYDWVIKTQGKNLDNWATWANGATTETNPTSPFGSTSSGVYDGFGGMVVKPLVDVSVSGFYLQSGQTATEAKIFDSSMNVIAMTTIVGNYANFSASPVLKAGQTYKFLVWAVGYGYTFKYNSTGISYPYVKTYFNWTSGYDPAGAETTSYGFIISNVTINQGGVTLNSPSDSSISTTNLVTTNASATVIGGAYLTNATLYDNSTGTWGARNSTTLLLFLDSNGKTESNSFSQTTADGMLISMKSTGYYLYNVTMFPSCTASRVLVKFQNGTTITTSTTKSGQTFTFASLPYLSAGTSYRIEVDASGGSYTTPYNLAGIPVTGTYLDWVKRSINGANSSSSDLPNILSIGLRNQSTNITQTFTNTYTTSTKWNMRFCDSDGACGFATANYTFSIDATPPTILINGGNGTQNYGVLTQNHTLNYTITDTNLESCWIGYNGTNRTTPCTSGQMNTTNFTLQYGLYSAMFYANDSVGNLQSQNVSWSYKAFDNGQTYTSQIGEGLSSTFTLNITTSSERFSTATLIYNGTSYSPTISQSENDTYLTASKISPSVSSDTNYTFYWNVTLEDGTNFQTTLTNQTVLNMAIDNCGSYTYQLFNFTMLDEESQNFLNGGTENTSIKVDFQFKNRASGNIVINYSALYNKTNPARICSQTNLTASDYLIDGLIEYSSSGRFTEFYNIQNYSSSNIPSAGVIYLYDLNSSVGTEFKITYKDESFSLVPGALVQIQRNYVNEGLFKIVEIPKIGSSGYAIGKFVQNSVLYTLVITLNGEVLGTFNNIIPYCPNPSFSECEININSFGSALSPTYAETDSDFTSTLTYNTTSRTISSVYSIPSGVPSTVTLNVTIFDALGNTTACSDSLVSAGGTLSCVVPGSFGNTTVYASLLKGNSEMRRAIIPLKQTPAQIFGTNVMFLGIIVLLFIIGIGIQEDPKIMIVTLLLGLIVLMGINLVNGVSWIGTGATILWFVVAIIMILIKGGRR